MKLLRLATLCVLGFFVGNILGTCSRHLFAQTTQYETVELNSNNTVTLRGPIEYSSVLQIELKVAKLVAIRAFRSYPIYLVLDSPGGEVDAGRQLVEFLKIVPNLRTITVFAASMAAMTAELLPGSRLIVANGTLMLHRAAGTVSGQIEVGELESRLAYIKGIIYSMEVTIAERLGLSITDYKAKIKDELWLAAPEALKQKAVDKIVDIKCSQELTDKRVKTNLETIFGDIRVVYSGCPILRSPIE